MYKLLSKDPLSEIYVLNLLVKLMVHFNRTALDFSELTTETLVGALQSVSSEVYLNYHTGCIHYRSLGVDYPLLQLGEGSVVDAANWYSAKATKRSFFNFLAPKVHRPIPVQAKLAKALLYAYYAGDFTTDHQGHFTYRLPGIDKPGITGAIRYLILKPRDARLVLRDIVLHTQLGLEKRVALKALQLQAILTVTEFNHHLIGDIPWGLVHELASIR